MTSSSVPLQDSILSSTVFAAVIAVALGYAWRTWRQAYLGQWALFWALYVVIWSLYVTAYSPNGVHDLPATVALVVATVASFTARTLLALGIVSYLGLRAPSRRERVLIAAAVVGLSGAVVVLRELVAAGVLPRAAIIPFRPYFVGFFLGVACAVALLRPRPGTAPLRGRGLLAFALLVIAASDAWDVALEAWAGIGWLAAPDALLRFSAVALSVCDSLLAAGMMIAAVGTEHARAERSASDLRARDLQLQESQRLETVGQLAGGVAHDLNNLLTVMVGSLAFVREALPRGSDAIDDVDAASSAASRAAKLTRQLLTFARRHPVEPRIVDVAASVRALEPLLPALVGSQVELAIRLGPERATTWIDPTQLEQLLLNLVVNARDAMPNGGRLSIAAERIVLAPPRDPEPREVPDGAWVRLEVEDTGHGMD
ncbi:MAG TPA: histidine kinase dimerization/phospho-acceptor domain-containing protein, partial [Anaeromyxobacteraceae bacterium]|nr:histidine kinase dimerization/phospho-acceptor domain-containing protein [Anaeromyxobacteraceae bacterium]